MQVQAPSTTRSPRPSEGSLRLRRSDVNVSPLRCGRAVALGGLAEHRTVTGCQLVAAVDLDGTAWWIPAAAVWTDAVCVDPERCTLGHPAARPEATGLATARNRTAAFLAGLSDRLGWEAMLRLDRGDDLPALAPGHLAGDDELDHPDVVVLDGRVGHEVPTVVVLGPDVARWGAGWTWAAALRRALFGTQRSPSDPSELSWIADTLRRVGVAPAYVDVGNEALRGHGIIRASVQLLTT